MSSGNELVFVVTSGPEYPRELAYSCLSELRTALSSKFDLNTVRAAAYLSLNSQFEQPVVQKLTHYSDSVTLKLRNAEKDIAETKSILFEKVHTNLNVRQEKLIDLQTQTEQTALMAKDMERSTVKLKWNLWGALCKSKIFIIAMVCFVLMLLFIIINGFVGCGFLMEKCTRA